MAEASNIPGDRERALEELGRDYGSLRGRVVSYLCRTFRLDSLKAEDWADETMAQALAKMAQYNPSQSLVAWLCGIAHHLYVDHLRSAESRRTTADSDDLVIPASRRAEPEEAYRRKRLAECLEDEISKLPSLHGKAVLLCRLHGFSQEEAARALGISIRRLRQVLYEGIAKLRRSRRVRALREDNQVASRNPNAGKGRAGSNV